LEQFRTGATDDAANLSFMAGTLLLETYKEAIKFETVLREAPRNISDEDQYRALFHYKRFVVLFDRAGGHLTPKFHLLFHQLQECSLFGNPRYYHTYADESFNKLVARVARSCHRMCWGEGIFKKLFIAQKTGAACGYF